MKDPILSILENELMADLEIDVDSEIDSGRSSGGGSGASGKKQSKTITIPSSYNDDAITLQEKKLAEEIRKLNINNEKELRNLVEKDLVKAILGELGQSVKNNIVDQAKRKAYQWAAELGIPEKERSIEKLLSDLGEEEINGVLADIRKLIDDGVFNG